MTMETAKSDGFRNKRGEDIAVSEMALDPWTCFPGTTSNFGLAMVRKLLSYRDDNQARRVIRQAYVRGKDLSELPANERQYIETHYLRERDTTIKYYRGCAFIFSQNGCMITAYSVHFPQSKNYIGKKQVRDFNTYKAYLRDLDYAKEEI